MVPSITAFVVLGQDGPEWILLRPLVPIPSHGQGALR
jgi:hypothetical protein